jgi:hypothetical protein
MITVMLTRSGDSLNVGIVLPRGLKGRLEWRDQQIPLRGGVQRFSL